MKETDLDAANRIAIVKIEEASAFSKRNILKIAAVIAILFLLSAGAYKIHTYFNSKKVEDIEERIKDRNEVIKSNSDSIKNNKATNESLAAEILESKKITAELQDIVTKKEKENEKIDSIIKSHRIDYSYNIVFGYFSTKRANNKANNAE